LKKECIIKIVCEIKNNLNLPWIRGIYSIDRYSILLELYSKGLKTFLILSIKKNDPRFHLLFVPKVPKELNINTAFQNLLTGHIKGGQIRDITVNYPYLVLKIESTALYTLATDFNNLNIALLNEEGKIISSINSKMDNKKDYLSIFDKSIYSGHALQNKCGDFTLNKSLSLEFISKKTEEYKRVIIRSMKFELKKNQKLIEKLNKEKSEVDKKEFYKKCGELLKYNLKNIERGMSHIILKDFLGNEVEIQLNPEQSPVENMESFFKKYKKLTNKEEVLRRRICEIENRTDNLKNLILKLEKLEIQLFPKKIEEIVSEITKRLDLIDKKLENLIFSALIKKQSEPKKSKNKNKEPFLKLYSTTGKLMLVGRSASDNELLIKKFARGNDLWFHAEEVEGSHVVLKYNRRDEDFTEKDIEDASLIAAYYSKLRKYGEGNIVYTRCKYLSKPKESKPGFVIYHNNKTVFVKIDEARVRNILESSSLRRPE